MLPSHARLKRKQDFDRLRQYGTSYRSRYMKCVVLHSKQETPLVGFIVNKRVSRSAVKRNRLKRQMRAAVYPIYRSLPPDTILLLIAHPSLLGLEFAALEREVQHLLSKSNLC